MNNFTIFLLGALIASVIIVFIGWLDNLIWFRNMKSKHWKGYAVATSVELACFVMGLIIGRTT